MFADDEHKFAVQEHMFADDEHKFKAREHNLINDNGFIRQQGLVHRGAEQSTLLHHTKAQGHSG